MLANPKLNRSGRTKSIQNVTKEDINETEKIIVLKNRGKVREKVIADLVRVIEKLINTEKDKKPCTKKIFDSSTPRQTLWSMQL